MRAACRGKATAPQEPEDWCKPRAQRQDTHLLQSCLVCSLIFEKYLLLVQMCSFDACNLVVNAVLQLLCSITVLAMQVCQLLREVLSLSVRPCLRQQALESIDVGCDGLGCRVLAFLRKVLCNRFKQLLCLRQYGSRYRCSSQL